VADFGPFPDPERAVGDLLADLAAGGSGNKTYTSLQSGPLPYIRVRRTAGSDDEITDSSVIDISVFADDASTAKSVAESCRQRLTSGPFRGTSFITAHGRIDRAVTDVAPQLVTTTDSANLQLVAASYRITMRREI
jgi:hypothetical protein